MLKNYLTVAFRHLVRNKAFSFINLAGLAVGMAACVLILLYVRDERSYDQFHEKADHLYRLAQAGSALTPPPLAPALAQTYAGIEGFTRIMPSSGDVLIRQGESLRFYEKRFYWADSTLFSLFSFPLLKGNPDKALTGVYHVVITEDIARKYFGDEDPMGRILIFDIGMKVELTVTGVMANPPANAHFRPDFLASLFSFEAIGYMTFDDWDQNRYYSYISMRPGQSAETIEAGLPTFFETHTGTARPGYQVQPVPDIHLYSNLEAEAEPPGDPGYVATFALIALLILVVACINFMNLSTARSSHRTREVSMRKVLGAGRAALVRQFLGESLLLSFLALLLTIPLLLVALPLFNTIAEKDLSLQAADLLWAAPVLVLLAGLVGLIAGSYPAFFLSSFAPLRILKGRHRAGSPRVRQALVITQFAIGLVLAIGTMVAHRQLGFLQTKNLGFDEEQVVVISARTYGHAAVPLPFDTMIEQFTAQSGVRAAAATGDVPSLPPVEAPFMPEGLTDLDAMAETTWNLYDVDVDFIETLGLEVVAGRSFKRDVITDETEAFIINEAAARQLVTLYGEAWANPVGKKLDRYQRADLTWMPERPGRIIGVVGDFHYASLHHRIAPLVMQQSERSLDHLVVRLQPGNATGTVAALENIWMSHLPERPFEYFFLDAEIDRLYRAEARMTTLMDLFSGLGLFIACLGLFGLAAFTAERRTKEIGIRKALGASVPSIIVLLSKEFTRLVLMACLIAAPIAYFIMRGWLSDFAYRIDLSWSLFLLAGVMALGIAWLTVGYQSIKAALTDPVDSLRYE